jgi:hypothetical protein
MDGCRLEMWSRCNPCEAQTITPIERLDLFWSQCVCLYLEVHRSCQHEVLLPTTGRDHCGHHLWSQPEPSAALLTTVSLLSARAPPRPAVSTETVSSSILSKMLGGEVWSWLCGSCGYETSDCHPNRLYCRLPVVAICHRA